MPASVEIDSRSGFCGGVIRAISSAEKYLDGNTNETIDSFLGNYPDLFKGDDNLQRLRQIFDTKSKRNTTKIENYQTAMKYIIDTYYIPKPYICKSVFFPGQEKEDIVVNMVRTCKESLDICMFTMTNDKLFEALEECWFRGIDIRV